MHHNCFLLCSPMAARLLNNTQKHNVGPQSPNPLSLPYCFAGARAGWLQPLCSWRVPLVQSHPWHLWPRGSHVDATWMPRGSLPLQLHPHGCLAPAPAAATEARRRQRRHTLPSTGGHDGKITARTSAQLSTTQVTCVQGGNGEALVQGGEGTSVWGHRCR